MNPPMDVENDEIETHNFKGATVTLLKMFLKDIFPEERVFLQELVSNSCDAIDTYLEVPEKNPKQKLEIKLYVNEETRTLTIIDTGLGMTKEELIQNLGTIAKFGTEELLDKELLLRNKGLRFLSVFLVADKVTVTSKSDDEKYQYIWEANAGSETFTVKPDYEPDKQLKRGTKVVLHLKEEKSEYAKLRTIKEFIRKNCTFVEKDIVVIDEYKSESVNIIWKHLPPVHIWDISPREFIEREYRKMYKSIDKKHTHHNLIQYGILPLECSEVKFECIFFIPGCKCSKLNILQDISYGINLYIRKMLVKTECKIVPEYLSFMKAIIQSDDASVSVNLSRTGIRKELWDELSRVFVNKCFELFESLPESKAEKFYNFFQTNIKRGIHEDPDNRDKLAALLRYETSRSRGKKITLTKYVGRMLLHQDYIYYIIGGNIDEVKNSPLIEYTRQCYEVIYMTDTSDQYVAHSLEQFNGRILKCLNSYDPKLHIGTIRKIDDNNDALNSLCKKIHCILKETDRKVYTVQVSDRLEESPCCVTNYKGWTENYGQLMILEKPRDKKAILDRVAYDKVFEINAKHTVIKKLLDVCDGDEMNIRCIVTLLYDTAFLECGHTLSKPKKYTSRIFDIIEKLCINNVPKSAGSMERLQIMLESDSSFIWEIEEKIGC